MERSALASFEENLLDQLASKSSVDALKRDALEQSDLEEELASWLNRRNIANASRLASGLVEAGVDRAALEKLGAEYRDGVLSHVLARVVARRRSRTIDAGN